jgi:electron transport complex protein RnfE
MWEGFEPFTIMVEAPGAFICLGLILAFMNYMNHRQLRKRNEAIPDSPLPSCGSCSGCSGGRA